MANDQSKALAIDIIARVDKLEKGMERAKKAANDNFGAIERRGKQMSDRLERDIGNAAMKVTGSLTGLGKAFLGGLAGGIFAGGLEGFARGVKSTVSELATLHKTIERIGLDAKVFQELQFGFQLAGVGAEAFSDGLDKFNKNIAVAATQGGKLADILKANGVAIRDQNGNIRDAQSLLRAYADLVKNAGSEAEQMLLVQEAFGRGDANFVNALKNGSKGFDDMGKAAADAGGTISKELLEKADKFDDRWDRAWHNFEVRAKSAILSVLSAMDGLSSRYDEYTKQKNAAELGAYAGSLAGTKDDGRRARVGTPDARVRDAFDPALRGALSEADKALIAELQKRYANAGEKAAKTIIPEKPEKTGSSRNAAAEKALREAEAVQKLIDALNEELRLVGASDLEKAKSNALRRAGAAATAEQKAEIERIVTAIYTENDALDKQRERMEELRYAAQDFTSTLINGLLDGNSATEVLSSALKQLGSQLLNSGLSGLFGGGGGGGLFSSLFGGGGTNWAALSASGKYLFDEGGYTGPGGVKQPAGVVHRGEVVWSQKDVARAGGVSAVEAMRKGLAGYAGGGPVAMPQIRVPTMPKIDSMRAAQPAAATNVNITVDVRGANGNTEIMEMVQRGVDRGIKQFSGSPAFTVLSARATKTAFHRGIVR
jgi:hypothetical protein